MTKHLPFSYDHNSGYLCNDKAFIITGLHLTYLTVVLNSTIFKFAFKDRFPELLGDTREVRKVFVEKIPIRTPINKNEEVAASLLTEAIVFCKKAEADPLIAEAGLSSNLIRWADALVMEWYFTNQVEGVKASIQALLLNHLPDLKPIRGANEKMKAVLEGIKKLEKEGMDRLDRLFEIQQIKMIIEHA